MPKENGVIINVYVESRDLQSDRRTDPIKRINPKQSSTQPRVFRTRGYDRRAQLLAYAQELRHADAQQLRWPLINSKRKPKRRMRIEQRWRWKVTVEKIKRMFSRFDGIKRNWKYEQIVTEDYCDGEESCNMKKGRRRSRRHSRDFCKKLKCLLKKISRAWKCKIDSFRKAA